MRYCNIVKTHMAEHFVLRPLKGLLRVWRFARLALQATLSFVGSISCL